MENLSKYFKGVASKQLVSGEVRQEISNQHEFNGTRSLCELFGKPIKKKRYPADFLYLTDDEDMVVRSKGELTWYDARANVLARNAEWRLYYSIEKNRDMVMQEGDTIFLCLKNDDTVLTVITKKNSTAESQVRWLFDAVKSNKFKVSDKKVFDREIGFSSKVILEDLGVELLEDNSEDWTEKLIEKFGGSFPTTREFSEFARLCAPESDPVECPDDQLLVWVNQEDILFRTMERYLISQRIQRGFLNKDGIVDIDGFMQFSLSVQNRRKSRAGQSLENHLEVLFQSNNIRYDRTPITENRSKPDFIFPGIQEYQNPEFDTMNLTMLGVKTTCKDRWRQVLAEADRIEKKHLLTLQGAISKNQTDEMRDHHLQLVVPEEIRSSFLPDQQSWLINIKDFLGLVSDRQNIIGY